jgi:hypothetical protein
MRWERERSVPQLIVVSFGSGTTKIAAAPAARCKEISKKEWFPLDKFFGPHTMWAKVV